MQAGYPVRPLAAGFAIVAIGILVGMVTMLGLTYVRPVMFALAFSGLVLLIPTVMVRDPKAYWLFLFVLSFLFNVGKRTTTWLADPLVLFHDFGFPALGTLSIDIYPHDVILFMLLIPWLAQFCLRHESLFFPRVALIFVLYLAWALIASLLEAQSLYTSIFEWFRELLYFVAFIYIVNDVVRRSQFRAIVLALFVGLVIAAGSVIAFFDLGIGPETYAFSGLYRPHTGEVTGQVTNSGPMSKLYSELSSEVSHTERSSKRSSGIFVQPAHAAYYIEYILPLVLGYLLTTRRTRDRVLLGGLFGLGCLALFLTFSRAGLIGLFSGIVVLIALAGWSGLISRRAFGRWAVTFAILAALTSPFLIYSLWARPQTLTKRMELNEEAVSIFWQRPIMGYGLNYGSTIMEGGHKINTTATGRITQEQVVHNFYLIVLIEVGLVGFLLFFAFFGQTLLVGVRYLQKAAPESKVLLAGLVSGLAAVFVHNLGDPFGAHSLQAMLWLYTGLIFAICRRIQAQAAAPQLQGSSTLSSSANRKTPFGSGTKSPAGMVLTPPARSPLDDGAAP